MNTSMETTSYYSKHASLALMAQRLGELKIWEQMCDSVTLQQKMYEHCHYFRKLALPQIRWWLANENLMGHQ